MAIFIMTRPWLTVHLAGFETRLALIVFDSADIILPSSVGTPQWAKISLYFISVAAAFGLNPGDLSVEAVAPDEMLLVETWGLGFSLPTEAALSETIPVQQISLHKAAGGWRRRS